MPIPKPKDGETKKEFISRCMGNDLMVKDYPDNKQRGAVCYSAWDKKDEKESDMKIERRLSKDTEIRAEGDGKKLVGYAAVFNSLSEELWGFREKIAPGAFQRSINAGADVRALFNHDPNFVLGRTTAKTLSLSEDSRGLKVEISPPDIQWANDLVASITRKDITQMSFGFRVVKEQWEEKEDENIRTLLDVDLFDVAPVTFPAYTGTSIQSRSLAERDLDIEGIERVFIRVEHKLPLTDKDRQVIHRATDVFAGLEEILRAGAMKGQGEITRGAPELVAIRKRLLALRNRQL
jgi:HK97 family phage prohead protease